MWEKCVASPLLVKCAIGTTFRCPLYTWGERHKDRFHVRTRPDNFAFGVPHISVEPGLHVVHDPQLQELVANGLQDQLANSPSYGLAATIGDDDHVVRAPRCEGPYHQLLEIGGRPDGYASEHLGLVLVSMVWEELSTDHKHYTLAAFF